MAPLAALDACPIERDNTAYAPLGVLIAGNFLSGAGGNRGVCEDLAERLGVLGWRVVTASRYTGRVARVADILHTAWSKRRNYEVAQIDLFSGPAFFWALALGWLLGRLRKPYVLTLHGGNLPDFSNRWPRITGWLLRGAAAVTAPRVTSLALCTDFVPISGFCQTPSILRVIRFAGARARAPGWYGYAPFTIFTIRSLLSGRLLC